MKQITKITTLLALIIIFASCQSSKSGCYDFSVVNAKIIDDIEKESKPELLFTNVICKP